MTQVEKIFVTSTINLPSECAAHLNKLLSNGQAPAVEYGAVIYPHGEYGFLVSLPEYHDVSWPLSEAAHVAKEHGCCWVLYDRDADAHPDLTVHNW